jgi:hypothetical protein
MKSTSNGHTSLNNSICFKKEHVTVIMKKVKNLPLWMGNCAGNPVIGDSVIFLSLRSPCQFVNFLSMHNKVLPFQVDLISFLMPRCPVLEEIRRNTDTRNPVTHRDSTLGTQKALSQTTT